MDGILLSIEQTARLVLRMGSVMFISLFGMELLMQLGLMRYLKPLGRPVARLANLPSESALTFLTAIGSMIAAHTMLAGYYQDGRVTDRELAATGVLNTVPFHFKETLTFQLPIVLPLLGLRLCLIYIAAFWLTGLLKLAFVVIYGRLKIEKRRQAEDVFDGLTCDPLKQTCEPMSLRRLLLQSWRLRRKLFVRMITLLAAVTLIVQVFINTGAMSAIESVIAPLTALLGLPAVLVGPISAYIFSPTVGITYMANLLSTHAVDEFQAIVALLAGGVLMIPATRLRRTLPRYTAIFGFKNGGVICFWTTLFSMLARLMLLAAVLLFFH